ncbi:MAG: methyltransferase type 11, partial [Synergistaceae bacterium]|nr:methyltransferase type 11 [Synergistaceae bacterium]
MNKYAMDLRRRSKKLTSQITEGMIFLRRFFGAPRQIGSVMPSSPYLTKAMMGKIDWNGARYIAELGAGTGVFTRSIVRKLRDGGKVLVFEIDPALKILIEAETPGLIVYGDARDLPEVMEDRNIPFLDYVVSSLPFAVLPPRMTASILDAVGKSLKPGGKLIAYQYSKHMKPYFEKRFESV